MPSAAAAGDREWSPPHTLPVTDCEVDPTVDLPEAVVVGGQPAVMFPIAESNRNDHAALVDAGYDAELTEVPGGHLEPITPGTEGWDTYVATIVATAHGG